MKNNLRNMTDAELITELAQLKEELRKIRFSNAMTRSESNTKRTREAKKEVARIFTILHERGHYHNKPQAKAAAK